MEENPEERSRIMRSVKSRNTGAEMIVRRLTHSMGYRYRLHYEGLPGKPDMVFPGRRKIIFVHGCFWHQHTCPRGARLPKSHREYWTPKLERNKVRDRKTRTVLIKAGWKVLVIWECEIKNRARTKKRIQSFLEG